MDTLTPTASAQLEQPLTQCGDARIVYDTMRDNPDLWRRVEGFPPTRDGDIISFPVEFADLEMWALTDQRGNKQFLATPVRWDGDEADQPLYHGGADESTFLVSVDPALRAVFLQGGAEAFYQALKPDVILELEDAFGHERTVRQGDVFAYRLPVEWIALWQERPRRAGPTHEAVVPNSSNWQIGGTRHYLLGEMAFCIDPEARFVVDGTPFAFAGLIVEGALTAPDHASRELEGPHLIAPSAKVMSAQPGLGD